MESSIEFLEASSLRAVSETAAPASEKGMSEEMTEDEQGQGGLSQRRSPQNPRPARVAVCGIQPQSLGMDFFTHCNRR